MPDTALSNTKTEYVDPATHQSPFVRAGVKCYWGEFMGE